GDQFAAALCDRAAHGVKVHVMLDSVGSGRMAPHYVQQLKHAGAQVVKYHPLHWFALTAAQHRNNRTHRKLLIIDGQVGFTGGVGIADQWMGDADSAKHWRDNHYMIKGPAVAQLQAAFVDNWMETTGHVLHGEDIFPSLKNAARRPPRVSNPSPTTAAK